MQTKYHILCLWCDYFGWFPLLCICSYQVIYIINNSVGHLYMTTFQHLMQDIIKSKSWHIEICIEFSYHALKFKYNSQALNWIEIFFTPETASLIVLLNKLLSGRNGHLWSSFFSQSSCCLMWLQGRVECNSDFVPCFSLELGNHLSTCISHLTEVLKFQGIWVASVEGYQCWKAGGLWVLAMINLNVPMHL